MNRSGAGGRRRLLRSVVAATLTAAATASVGILWNLEVPSPAGRDLRGHRVALNPQDRPDGRLRALQRADDSGHGRFEVPSVKLDVPLGALTEAEGAIKPPGFTSVYWVRNRGVGVHSADKGTVFVVTHSLRGGGVAPGNYLIDVRRGTSSLRPGAELIVDGIHYTLDETQPIPKSQIADDASVWANTPNRLVVITCLQVPAGTASVDNLVITATRQAD